MIIQKLKQTEMRITPEGWDRKQLSEVLVLIRNGLTNTQNKENEGYPVTRIETISVEKINPEKFGYIKNIEKAKIDEFKLKEGDILFSHINSVEHIGKTAIYENTPELLIQGMNLLLLRTDKDKIEPKYFLQW